MGACREAISLPRHDPASSGHGAHGVRNRPHGAPRSLGPGISPRTSRREGVFSMAPGPAADSPAIARMQELIQAGWGGGPLDTPRGRRFFLPMLGESRPRLIYAVGVGGVSQRQRRRRRSREFAGAFGVPVVPRSWGSGRSTTTPRSPAHARARPCTAPRSPTTPVEGMSISSSRSAARFDDRVAGVPAKFRPQLGAHRAPGRRSRQVNKVNACTGATWVFLGGGGASGPPGPRAAWQFSGRSQPWRGRGRGAQSALRLN